MSSSVIACQIRSFLFSVWLATVISTLSLHDALPIWPWFQIADLNIGLLFIVGISALGIFGIVLGGWSSNSHYSLLGALRRDRKSTRLNSSHMSISYAVFCLKKKRTRTKLLTDAGCCS